MRSSLKNHRPGGLVDQGETLGEALRGNHPERRPVTLLIDNDIVRRVLKPAAVRRALESAYRDLASGEAVCRRASTSDPDARSREVLPWGTMKAVHRRYFASA